MEIRPSDADTEKENVPFINIKYLDSPLILIRWLASSYVKIFRNKMGNM